jgi:hypothetical protein
MNRRVPNGTHGGVRGRRPITASYSIIICKIQMIFLIRTTSSKRPGQILRVPEKSDKTIYIANQADCPEILRDRLNRFSGGVPAGALKTDRTDPTINVTGAV